MHRSLPNVSSLVLVLLALTVPIAAQETDHAPSPGERIKKMLDARGSGDAALALYRSGLEDPHADVRSAAVQFLWTDAGTRALEQILPLIADPDEDVSLAAALSLLGQDDPSVVAAIRKQLASRSTHYRAQIASSIGDRGLEEFVPDVAGLLSDEDAALRRTAIASLRAIGSPNAFPYFMQATGDGNPVVVAEAVASLASLEDSRALDRVAQLASAEDHRVRAAVGSAIPALGGTASRSEILDKLLADAVVAVRVSTVNGLGNRYTAASDPLIATALKSDDARVRRAAVVAVSGADPDHAAGLLAPLFRDPDPRIRGAAVTTVRGATSAEALAAVTRCATDPSSIMRAAVASTLGASGDPGVAATLVTLAKDADLDVRTEAVTACGSVPGKATFEVIARAASDADPYIRIAAIGALEDREEPEAREHIREAAADQDVSVRIAAITALGRLGDAKSAEVVRKALQDPVEPVRNAARAALAARTR